MIIPQEIVDLFIDDLAQRINEPESFKALLSCSYTSRAVNHRCREHIFSSISTSTSKHHVYPVPPRSKISLLEDLLECDNKVGAYIQHLHIDLGFSGSTVPELEAHLPRVLELIRTSEGSLKSVEISTRSMPMKFHELPPDVQGALFRCLEHSTVSTLKLAFIVAVPIQIFMHPNIKHLLIREVTFGYSFQSAQPNPRPELNPMRLHTLQADRFIINLASHLTLAENADSEKMKLIFSMLRTLSVRVTGRMDVMGFRVIMQAAATSLVTLDLSTSSDRLALPMAFQDGINLDTLPLLREMAFSLQILPDTHYEASSVLLQCPSRLSVLTALVIKLEWHVHSLADAGLPDETGWESLGQFMESPNVPCLKNVLLEVDLVVRVEGLNSNVVRDLAKATVQKIAQNWNQIKTLSLRTEICTHEYLEEPRLGYPSAWIL